MKCPKCRSSKWIVEDTVVWDAIDDQCGCTSMERVRSREIKKIKKYGFEYSEEKEN